MAGHLKQSFLKRGYLKHYLENQFCKTAHKTREQLLTKTTRVQNKSIQFVTTFNKNLVIEELLEDQPRTRRFVPRNTYYRL